MEAAGDKIRSNSQVHRQPAGDGRRIYAARRARVRRSGLIRVSRKEAQKLVELGYLSLESKGDPQKEGVAVEAYLGDNL
jgi:hypothetical protein